MLEYSGPKEKAFLPQLEGMLVQTNCTCGCPSFSIAPPPDETRVDLFRQKIIAEMLGELSDGTVGLILWQAGGKLTGLEVYDLAGRDYLYGLPRVNTLFPFENTSKKTAESGAPPSRS